MQIIKITILRNQNEVVKEVDVVDVAAEVVEEVRITPTIAMVEVEIIKIKMQLHLS